MNVNADALERLAREAPEMAPFVEYAREGRSSVHAAGRHLFFEAALLEIDDALREAGIEFLVLKGMALAYLVYPDPATRPMTDIDLYVRPADVERAAARLAALGYGPMDHQQQYTDELVRFGGELSLQRPQGPFVDLHWLLEQYERLRGVVRIDEPELWRRAMSYSVADRRFRTPSIEDQLLTLAIHLGLVHRMQGLRWLLDIDLTIRAYADDIDWPLVMERAGQWGILRLVLHTLWLSRKVFDTPLPATVRPRRVRGAATPAGQLVLLDRRGDRLRVIRRVLFPSADWLAFRYRLQRRRAVPLYRFLHPLFLLTGRFR